MPTKLTIIMHFSKKSIDSFKSSSPQIMIYHKFPKKYKKSLKFSPKMSRAGYKNIIFNIIASIQL